MAKTKKDWEGIEVEEERRGKEKTKENQEEKRITCEDARTCEKRETMDSKWENSIIY